MRLMLDYTPSCVVGTVRIPLDPLFVVRERLLLSTVRGGKTSMYSSSSKLRTSPTIEPATSSADMHSSVHKKNHLASSFVSVDIKTGLPVSEEEDSLLHPRHPSHQQLDSQLPSSKHELPLDQSAFYDDEVDSHIDQLHRHEQQQQQQPWQQMPDRVESSVSSGSNRSEGNEAGSKSADVSNVVATFGAPPPASHVFGASPLSSPERSQAGYPSKKKKLPANWKKAIEQGTQRVYYYNKVTRRPLGFTPASCRAAELCDLRARAMSPHLNTAHGPSVTL
eukprot:CAMPEP_0175151354 /NCGR_PEP_ID=MMETSP0087-20121206/18452_1 /TAXON_ID=136419 /ORGANISM="Unknown Unknown, Strain D1" /LENGTH=278 /DNA_ID=CAMNT_0016437547 /DNA_START=118 /DNA_END=955 /DNA_ORIENTATION=-